jgi:hypothetical protein
LPSKSLFDLLHANRTSHFRKHQRLRTLLLTCSVLRYPARLPTCAFIFHAHSPCLPWYCFCPTQTRQDLDTDTPRGTSDFKSYTSPPHFRILFIHPAAIRILDPSVLQSNNLATRPWIASHTPTTPGSTSPATTVSNTCMHVYFTIIYMYAC